MPNALAAHDADPQPCGSVVISSELREVVPGLRVPTSTAVVVLYAKFISVVCNAPVAL